MASSTTTAHLGRQFWSSVRDGVGFFAWRLPMRPRPLSRLGIGQSSSSSTWSCQPPTLGSSPFERLFHTTRPFSRSTRLTSKDVRRSCTSGGLLLLGLSAPTSSTQTVVATCTAAADSAIVGSTAQKSNIGRLARQTWQRSIHTGRPGRPRAPGRRNQSTKAGEDTPKGTAAQPEETHQRNTPPETREVPQSADAESIANSVSKYLHLRKKPHRPTKEELLAAASGFWSRLKVRFKWFSIRSMRPWNADEWGAFVSWFMLGHLVWILVGTTTFFSLVILTVNTVFAQGKIVRGILRNQNQRLTSCAETLAKWVGDYLTKSAGVTVVFESAIVPKWKDGVITFRNVFVSRRPGQTHSTVQKGSSFNAAAVAAARQAQIDGQAAEEEDDGNYTQFDVTINTVNVTLSFLKWWNGTGLLKDVEVKGVRGIIDRTSVRWSAKGFDPLSFRHEHSPGDFEIEHFKLEDLLVTVHQPGGFRPFPASIYSCELPQLRRQWLFYDFLSANHMSGSFDGSLFTIHPRQIRGVAAGDGHAGQGTIADNLGEPSVWKKFSRIRIDGLKIDHLNRGVEGPFGWIYEGNVDVVADIMWPADADEGIGKVMSNFYDRMEEAVTSNRYLRILDQNVRPGAGGVAGEDTTTTNTFELDDKHGHLTNDTHTAPSQSAADAQASPSSLPLSDSSAATAAIPSRASPPLPTDPPRYQVMDLRLHLNNVKAAVPLFTSDISYISQPLVRPIVAYINANRTYIPITCRIVKRASDFDGAWTVYDCGLMADLGAEVYAAFARDVEEGRNRVRRLKKVGFWTLSMVVHALFVGVAGDLI